MSFRVFLIFATIVAVAPYCLKAVAFKPDLVQPTRFAVIGDFGDHANNADQLGAVASLVKSLRPQFVVTVGDNNYPDGEASTIEDNIDQYYGEFISSNVELNRFFPALGNHDWACGEECQTIPEPHVSHFALPEGQGEERYYDFVKGDVHFFILDSDRKEPDGIHCCDLDGEDVQASWLNDQIQASTSRWKFVFLHHPPYVHSGPHCPDNSKNPNPQEEQRAFQDWQFDLGQIDAVFSGHNHHYEANLNEAQNHHHPDGLWYFINGAGGKNMTRPWQLEDCGLPPYVDHRKQYIEKNGAQLVTVDRDQAKIEFYNIDHELIHSVTIRKP